MLLLRLPAGGHFLPLSRLSQEDRILGRIGCLEVRLASKKKHIRKAQRLRYEVFFEEGNATPDLVLKLARRDMDAFDAICDHLLVVDTSRRFGRKIVGTYRLLRRDVADQNFGFYSESEFDLDPFLNRHPTKRLLELGRSCVLKPYRDKRTVELLWLGIWKYVLQNQIDVMFGCASFEGTDPERLALPLSYLSHFASAPPEWHVRALENRYVRMDRLKADEIEHKRAILALPPLIKGYLRAGARFGEGAVIDRSFNTTDVIVVLPVASIAPRYTTHFGRDIEQTKTTILTG
jgi:putative hemolysin